MAMLDTWFPGRAAKRAELRLKKKRADLQLQLLERRFEGAARGRRNEGWRTAGNDANAEIGPALAILRNRARDLRQNNPYAERAITGIADNVAGAGIIPRPLAKSARANKRLQELWDAWAGTALCDADGLESFYGLQHKAMESVPECGEVFVRRRRRLSSDGLPVPLQIQMLEADFLDEQKTGLYGGNKIIQGIEFDALGKRVAYWMFDEHPGATNVWKSLTSRRIPAEDVIHIFLPKRPGQARGYTWFAPVMQRLRNFDEMEDAVMEQAKIAACFAAFVTKDESSTGASNKRPPLVERVEPGIIQELAQGETVSFGTPPTFNGYSTYSWQGLHAISVGLGVPYELVTGDLKGVNFSSGRMGWLHFARRVDVWQWRMLIPQLCNGVWAWFMEAQMLVPGGILEPAGVEWTPPRRDMVDPKTEIETVKQMLRNGLITWPDALRQLGITNPEAHAKNIEEANALLDKLGLIFDFDPRKVAAAGAASQPQPEADPEKEPQEENPDDVPDDE